MSFIGDTVRKIAFWTYPRTSWQWDVLCVLILVFIFLTPKSWFSNTAYQHMTIVMSTDVVGAQLDKTEIEQRAKQLARRPDAAITAVRDRRDDTGKLIGYEVDIR
jgi:hypothetical protein